MDADLVYAYHTEDGRVVVAIYGESPKDVLSVRLTPAQVVALVRDMMEVYPRALERNLRDVTGK